MVPAAFRSLPSLLPTGYSFSRLSNVVPHARRGPPHGAPVSSVTVQGLAGEVAPNGLPSFCHRSNRAGMGCTYSRASRGPSETPPSAVQAHPAEGPPAGAPHGPQGPFSTCAPRVDLLRLSFPLLAPKKKGAPSGQGGPAGAGAAGAAGAGSSGSKKGYDHVFNIYKDIEEDHELLPDSCYPQWLWRLQEKPKTYGELAMVFLYGRVRQRSPKVHT